MKIVMIGAGAAGSVFASYLRKGGADITLVDFNKEHLDKVAADGMVFTHAGSGSGTELVTGFKIAYSAEEAGLADMVIYMTKATQLENAITTSKACVGENTIVACLLNGLGNDTVMLRHFPKERILIGHGTVGTALKALGHCVSTENTETHINVGCLENTPELVAACDELVALFLAGGADAKRREDIQPYIWRKAMSNSCVNTIPALLRVTIGQVAEDPFGRSIYMAQMKESYAVATAMGVSLDFDEFLAYQEHVFTEVGDYYPSMCQDMLMNKRQTEIDNLNGAIVEYGKQVGVDTPVNWLLSQMVRFIQANYDKQYFKS